MNVLQLWAGNLYIADRGNHRIRVLTPMTGDGTEGTVLPMIGPALAAILNAARFTPAAAPTSLQSLFGERLAFKTAVASVRRLRDYRRRMITNSSPSRAAPRHVNGACLDRLWENWRRPEC